MVNTRRGNNNNVNDNVNDNANNNATNQRDLPPPPPLMDANQPPTLSQAVEPMEADDWLKTIESKLQIARCIGREKVLFASHQLIGPAQEWCIADTAAHEDPLEITWAEFRDSFRTHNVPVGEVKLKRKEFLNLKKRPMSVREYLTKFTQFSR
ncbi:uncharacterized protein LOC133914655 [Phragmites australis]|uniref:uncharacterized protein LOC133914655 n=1 Tax=Phragmites australis TaxID=29695 RepID=UPI002D76B5CB|nr:uncharacterized protein LOC133914655 [Phragmites australis]